MVLLHYFFPQSIGGVPSNERHSSPEVLAGDTDANDLSRDTHCLDLTARRLRSAPLPTSTRGSLRGPSSKIVLETFK